MRKNVNRWSWYITSISTLCHHPSHYLTQVCKGTLPQRYWFSTNEYWRMVRSGEKTQWLLFWQLAIFSTISASTRQEQEFWHLKTCFTSSMTMKLLIFNTGNAMSVYFCNILFIRTIYPKSYPISSLHKHTHTHTHTECLILLPDFVRRNFGHFKNPRIDYTKLRTLP